MLKIETPPAKTWLTVLTLVIVPLAVALIHEWPKFHTTTKPPVSTNSEVTTTFSGLVRSRSGHPVARAHVEAAIDGHIPTLLISDSEGVFHLTIPSTATSLHLSVLADGFENFDRDADPHRTSLEIIELQLNEPMPADKTPIRRVSPRDADKAITSTQSGQRSSQSGEGNQQAMLGNQGVSQVMKDSPGGIQIGGNVIVGPVVPPPRVISEANMQRAISTLKFAPEHSKVGIAVIGNSPEIQSFAAQIQQMFTSASPTWVVGAGNGYGSVNGEQVEGFNCAFLAGNAAPDAAAQVALKAFSEAGYPCGNGPGMFYGQTVTVHGIDYKPPNDIDIWLSIGTRIPQPSR